MKTESFPVLKHWWEKHFAIQYKRDCVDRECSLCSLTMLWNRSKGGLKGVIGRWSGQDGRRQTLVGKIWWRKWFHVGVHRLVRWNLEGHREAHCCCLPIGKRASTITWRKTCLDGMPSLQIPKRSPVCTGRTGNWAYILVYFFIDVVKVTVTKQKQNMSHFCLMNCDMILISQNAYLKIASKKWRTKALQSYIFSVQQPVQK